MAKLYNYEFVSVSVPANSTGTRYYFPDLPNLRYVSLMGVSVYSNKAVPSDPNGIANAAVADLKNSFLILFANERESVFRVPLVELNRIEAEDGANFVPFVRHLIDFNGQKITWPKSYVQMSAAPSVATAFSFCFGVYYA